MATIADARTIDEQAADAARGRPLGFSFKAQYGIGAIADGVVTAGLGFFLLFYLTAVCGLSGAMAGAAQLVALLVDAVADPAIGLMSDRVRSRMGRRLPFMIGAIVPFAAAFGLIFSIPTGLTGIWLFVYVTACLVVVRLSLSCFVLPFTAVGAEVTDDYRERAAVVSYRLTFQNGGVLIAVMLGLGVFMSGTTGLLERGNYVPFAWACAAAVLVSGLVAIRAVRKALPRLHEPAEQASGGIGGFVRELGELLRNRSFLCLFGTVVIYFLAYSTSGALALHATRYFWHLDPSAIQLVLLSVTLGPLLGAPLSAYALRHIEKRTLSIMAFLAIALLQLWPPLFQLLGWLSLTSTVTAVVLFVNTMLIGTAIMVGGIGFQSMLADTADEHEYLFGVRREGLFFSGLTLAYKAAAGLGGLIAGLALDAIGFPADLAAQGTAITIPDDVVANLGLIAGPLPAAFSAIAPLFLLGYGLTRKKHAAIIRQLEQRHAGKGRKTA